MAVVVLLAAGVLGSQGGGEGIEDVVLLDPPSAEGVDITNVGPERGKLAPDFEISDFDGTRHRLSDFRGKAVVVNFWATWCVPCQIELPDMVVLQANHPDELAIITVNREESLGDARSFLENLPNLDGGKGVSFTVNGMDPDDTLYDEYRALGMPSSFFISPDGVVTGVSNGLLRLEQMEDALSFALAGDTGDRG